MSEPIEESIFDPFEAEHDHPARPSLVTLLRRLRIRYVPNTITAHEGELRAALAFPLGMTWRRYKGRSWCPFCTSISPASLVGMMRTLDYWDRDRSVMEMRSLVERKEMAHTPETWSKAINPPFGSGFAYYSYDQMITAPDSFFLVVKDQRFIFALPHIWDLPVHRRAEAFNHMNRLAPNIHWTLLPDGSASWSSVGTITIFDDDSSVYDGDDDDPTNSNQPEENPE